MQFIIKKKRRGQLVAEFIKQCSEKFSKENQERYGSERSYCDGNWCTNLYLVYLNDYITFDRFFESELDNVIDLQILHSVSDKTQYVEEYEFLKDYCLKLLGSFGSLKQIAFKAEYNQIGSLILTAISEYGC